MTDAGAGDGFGPKIEDVNMGKGVDFEGSGSPLEFVEPVETNSRGDPDPLSVVGEPAVPPPISTVDESAPPAVEYHA